MRRSSEQSPPQALAVILIMTALAIVVFMLLWLFLSEEPPVVYSKDPIKRTTEALFTTMRGNNPAIFKNGFGVYPTFPGCSERIFRRTKTFLVQQAVKNQWDLFERDALQNILQEQLLVDGINQVMASESSKPTPQAQGAGVQVVSSQGIVIGKCVLGDMYLSILSREGYILSASMGKVGIVRGEAVKTPKEVPLPEEDGQRKQPTGRDVSGMGGVERIMLLRHRIESSVRIQVMIGLSVAALALIVIIFLFRRPREREVESYSQYVRRKQPHQKLSEAEKPVDTLPVPNEGEVEIIEIPAVEDSDPPTKLVPIVHEKVKREWRLEAVDDQGHVESFAIPPHQLARHRKGFVVGRSGVLCDLYIGDDTLSKRQFRLVLDDEARLWIEDLNSTNGTLLHGKQLSPFDPTPVSEGDVIVPGSVTLKIVLSSG